jgi:hypothetical protein
MAYWMARKFARAAVDYYSFLLGRQARSRILVVITAWLYQRKLLGSRLSSS